MRRGEEKRRRREEEERRRGGEEERRGARSRGEGRRPAISRGKTAVGRGRGEGGVGEGGRALVPKAVELVADEPRNEGGMARDAQPTLQPRPQQRALLSGADWSVFGGAHLVDGDHGEVAAMRAVEELEVASALAPRVQPDRVRAHAHEEVEVTAEELRVPVSEEAVGGDRKRSEAIEGRRRQSEAIGSHRRPSEAIGGGAQGGCAQGGDRAVGGAAGWGGGVKGREASLVSKVVAVGLGVGGVLSEGDR